MNQRIRKIYENLIDDSSDKVITQAFTEARRISDQILLEIMKDIRDKADGIINRLENKSNGTEK